MQKFSRTIAMGTVVLGVSLLLWQQRDRQPSPSPILAEDPEAGRLLPPAEALAERTTTPVLAESTKVLVRTLAAGQPIALTLGGNSPPRRFLLRPRKVLADGFSVTIGSDTPYPAAIHSFDGRSIGEGFRQARIALAIVNDSVAALITESNGATLQIRTDPETGSLQTLEISRPEYDCRPDDGPESQFSMNAPVYSESDWEKGPTAKLEPLAVAGDDPASGALTRTTEITPWGQEYDQSLVDSMLVMVLDKEAAGDTSSANIASKTSQYLAVHSNVASIYEYQLGIRLLLQEFILIPNTGAYSGVTSGTPTAANSLDRFEIWMNANRPQGTYRWTTAALWDEFASGGTVGLANVDKAGTSTGLCTNKVGKSWSVTGHEIGHNLGARHTVGADGIMMASLSASGTNTRSFFSPEQTSGETGAFIVYENSRSVLLGSPSMRHPKEMPFANDDSISTAINTPVAVSPLGNDDLATPSGGGSNKTLTLIETGFVLPVGAGTTSISGNDVIFTPATGFEGTAWFSYTVRGDLGNSGRGWLHKADVAVVVGTPATPEFDLTLAPGQSFRMHLPPGTGAVDSITGQPSQGFAFNSLNYLGDAFYTVSANGGASGNDTLSYVKNGTPYTLNITYATAASWDVELEAGGSRILQLPPDFSAVSSLTQPSDGVIAPLIDNDTITVTGEGDYVYTQYYILRADSNASGTDSFTYQKGGVTYTVNITWLDVPVQPRDDKVATFDPTLGLFRVNPINNDTGPGLFAPGTTHTQLGPAAAAGIAAIANGRYLVSATNLTPKKGTLSFETRPITIAGVSTDAISGYLLFDPADGATGIAQIEYTVKDSAGNTDTGTVTIALGVVEILSPTGSNALAPDHGVVLAGATTDPPAPFSPVDSVQWTFSSNSGSVTFANAGALETKATFSSPGAYTLRLTATAADYVTAVETSVLVSSQPVPSDDLLVLINFDESSGTIAADASGNGHDATLKGTSPTWEPSGGHIDGSLNINASGEYATLPSISGYNDTTLDSYAVSIWFKSSDPNTAQGQILYEAGGTGSGHSLYLLNGELIAGSWDTINTVDWSFIQGPAVTAGVWHHAVLSVENNTKTLWYDGQIAGTAVGFSFFSDTNGNGIGAINLSTLIDENFNDNSASLLSSANGSRRFTGSLDRLTVHTRALSSADVQILYEANFNQAPAISMATSPLLLTSTNDLASLSASAVDTETVTTEWLNNTPLTGDAKLIIESPDQSSTDILFNAFGQYEICFTAADDQIKVFKSRLVNVQGSGTDFYAQWFFSHPEIDEEDESTDSSFAADLDGDRLANLVEYAISAHPAVPSDALRPTVSIVEVTGQNYLQLSYRRLRDTGADESVGRTGIDRTYHGVTYTVEVIEDLASGNWQSGAGLFTVIGSPIDNGDGSETITVRLPTPIETAPRQFVKLTATEF